VTPPDDAPSSRVLVVGGGTMGVGIAQVLLSAGLEVHLIEATPAAAFAARSRLATSVARAAASGRPGMPAVTVLENLHARDDMPADLQVDLVVEAVPEYLKLKQEVLAKAGQLFPGALLATNTSSLSIDELAQALPDPSALVGLHFFNPVPASTLIEIVVGLRTRPDVVERAHAWCTRMGKHWIEVKDSPGFATSRLGVALGLKAIRMLEAGVASAADIDRGMVLGYKHPVGPLELTDRVGLDVRLAIARHLEVQLGPRFAPPRLLVDLVDAGHLGRKTGRGLFYWDAAGQRSDAAPLLEGLVRG